MTASHFTSGVSAKGHKRTRRARHASKPVHERHRRGLHERCAEDGVPIDISELEALGEQFGSGAVNHSLTEYTQIVNQSEPSSPGEAKCRASFTKATR